MKKLLIIATIIAAFTGAGVATAEARSYRHYDDDDRDYYRDSYYAERYHNRDYRRSYHNPGNLNHGRTSSIWVIEHNRPVRRVVYLDSGGAYYRIVSGRRVYIREHYYTSYPSRYYYSDGRPRVGVSIRF